MKKDQIPTDAQDHSKVAHNAPIRTPKTEDKRETAREQHSQHFTNRAPAEKQ